MRRWIIVAVALQGFTLSCDVSSPTGPKRVTILSAPAYTVTPSGLTATAVSWSEIDLAWPKGSNAPTGYEIFRSNAGIGGNYSLLATVGASATTYADAGRSASTQYCYEIRSYKIAGKNTQYSSFSSAACATTPAPPPNAPSQVDAVPAGSSSVVISWIDNSSNEDGFRIERAGTIAGPWTQIAVTAANATTNSQSVVAEQVTCFRVIAFNAAGPSSPSSADCTASPAAPAKLEVRSVGRLSLLLGWQDNSGVEDGYTLSRLEGTSWSSVAKLGANNTQFTDTRLVAGQKYTYRVQATKDGGSSDYSNELTVTIAEPGPVVAPAAPTGLDVGFLADNEYGWLYFTATWNDASDNETGFALEYSDDGVSGWLPYAKIAANEIIFSWKLSLWDNLSPISQCFRIIATAENLMDSQPSNVSCKDWNTPPTNLSGTAVDQQTIDLTWTDNARFELGYLIYRSANDGVDYEFVAQTERNATSYRDTGLASGKEYWYFVILLEDQNSGSDAFNYSDRIGVTTPSGAVGASGSVLAPSRIVKRSVHDRPIVRKHR